MTILGIFLIVFAIHNLLFFTTINKLIKFNGSKNTFYTIVIILTIIAGPVSSVFISYSMIAVYAFIIVVYSLFIIIFFKGNFFLKLATALYMPINIMALVMILNASAGLILDTSIWHIMSTSSSLYLIRIAVCSIHSLFLLIISKLVPQKYYRIYITHPTRLKLFLFLEVCIILCLITNTTSYSVDIFVFNLLVQQLLLGVSWLILFYLCIFMMIGFEIMELNKETMKNSKLIERMYKHILLDTVDSAIEVNCETGQVTNYIHQGEIQPEFIGTSYENLFQELISNYVHVEDRENSNAMAAIEYMIQTFDKGINKYEFEYRWSHTNKDFAWFNANVRVESQNNMCAIITISNVQEEKIKQFNAERDQLTGLYNKATTEDLIDKFLLQDAEQVGGYLFMIDLDNFKSINDTFGHAAGDNVLREVAHNINSIFRKDDIKGRIGGDEFLVFIPNSNGINIIEKSNVIINKLSKTYSNDNASVSVSPSIGIAKVDHIFNNFQDLYTAADSAMYKSKTRGKCTFTVYTHNFPSL